jgi:hypothetical protein
LNKERASRGGYAPLFFWKKTKRREIMKEVEKVVEKEIREAISKLCNIYETMKEKEINFTNSSLSIDSLLFIVKKIEKAYYQEN